MRAAQDIIGRLRRRDLYRFVQVRVCTYAKTPAASRLIESYAKAHLGYALLPLRALCMLME